MRHSPRYNRHARVRPKSHIHAVRNVADTCAVLGCRNPTMSASTKGRSKLYCKRHVEHKARHGSHWHRGYSATDLKPYIAAATTYVNLRVGIDPFIKAAVAGLDALLQQAPFEIATRLRGLPAKHRAQIALGRLRKAGIKPERLLSIHLAVIALVEEDPGSHRTKEFRLVQTAKAVHRLASGYHRVWEHQDRNGRVGKVELHKFPRSSGRVLRLLGELIADQCEWVVEKHLEGVLALKLKRYGGHPALAVVGE